MQFIHNLASGVKKIEDVFYGEPEVPCYRSCPNGWTKIKLNGINDGHSNWCVAPSNYVPTNKKECTRIQNFSFMNNAEKSSWASMCKVNWDQCTVLCETSCPDLYIGNGKEICSLEYGSESGLIENGTIQMEKFPTEDSRKKFAIENNIVWSQCTDSQKEKSLNLSSKEKTFRRIIPKKGKSMSKPWKKPSLGFGSKKSVPVPTPKPPPKLNPTCLEIEKLSGKEKDKKCLGWDVKNNSLPNYKLCKEQCKK